MNVQDYELKVAARAHLERAVAIVSDRDRKAVRLQEVGQQLRAGGVIVGDEYAAAPTHCATARRPSFSTPADRSCLTWTPNVRVSIGLEM